MTSTIDVGTRKGLFRVQRTNRGWEVAAAHFLGDNCSMLLHDARSQTTFCALEHGHFGSKVHRTHDDGRHWEEIGVPAWPPVPEGHEPQPSSFSGKVTPWSLQKIWELVPGSREQPGRLWCGAIPGGLFRSDDDGTTWEFVRTLWDLPERGEWFGGGYDHPGIHTVCVDPRDPDHLVLGISCGGAWRTRDAGETWALCARGMRAEYMPPERAFDENIQDPHRIARCTHHPDVLWAQHHNGVFRTTDNAATWTELDAIVPSGFGFGVAAHPHDPQTAWFVPGIKDEKRIPVDGRLVVSRTRDGGASFEVLTRGLPQSHAYDLVFRHALDVDDSGEVLAFGSTTGALFVSENGGDDWMCVTAHLPPIHVVSFR